VTVPLTAPGPDFSHLIHLTDGHGTFEHALFAEPRPEHGYCTDDMARVLVVTSREPLATPGIRRLTGIALDFLEGAIDSGGRCRNRMNRFGEWTDLPALDDCWGRSIWGLGAALSAGDDRNVHGRAAALFERACTQRSPFPRAMAFAALGAADVLSAHPDHLGARDLLVAAAETMPFDVPTTPAWAWPDSRLTYANAAVPEAMLAAGTTLDRPELVGSGLRLLRWLCDRETIDGHLSVTPVGGAGPTDNRPRFDQQPIEVAAMADACARAARIDPDPYWSNGVRAAVAWFLGDNDGQTVMWDEVTGGGFDGLEPAGANQNCGAESSLALLSTLQHARSFQLVAA
jgi:hypothetical protein